MSAVVNRMIGISKSLRSKYNQRCQKLRNKHKLRSGDTIISDANIPYVILLDVTNEMDFRDRAYVIGTSSEDIKHLSYHARKMGFDEMVFDNLEKEIDIEERNRDLYINDINLAIDDMREEIMEVDEERLGFESHLKWLEEKERMFLLIRITCHLILLALLGLFMMQFKVYVWKFLISTFIIVL